MKTERAIDPGPHDEPPRRAWTASQAKPSDENEGRDAPADAPAGEDRLANLKRQLAARLGERDRE